MACTDTLSPKSRLVTLHAVADELGVSIDTVGRYVRAGALPVVRLPSGRPRVDRHDLDRLIETWKTDVR
jgi:predicted site-specific integrase-resolvase